jgi:hypothetical protein
MARKAATSDADTDLQVISPRAVGFIVLVAALVAVCLGTWWMERENRKVQSLQRLTSDPVYAPWFASMQKEIAELEANRQKQPTPAAGDPKLAQHVWLGTVTFPDLGTKGRPTLEVIDFKNAVLLAGAKVKSDDVRDTSVKVTVRGFPFTHHGQPQPGQRWLVAIFFDERGFAFVRDAVPWVR